MPYFWGRVNIVALYLTYPLLMVLSTTEVLLVFPHVNVYALDSAMAAAVILPGVFLRRSADRYDVTDGEARSGYYLSRWIKLQVLKFGGLSLAASLSVAFYLHHGLLLGGNPLFTMSSAWALLYVAAFYMMTFPIFNWQPKPYDFLRIRIANLLEQSEVSIDGLKSILRSVSSLYGKEHHRRRLLPLAFTRAARLDAGKRRSLTHGIQREIQHGNVDGALRLVATATGSTFDEIEGPRWTRSEVIKWSTCILTLVASLFAALNQIMEFLKQFPLHAKHREYTD
jgi:hypothetical protein